MPTTTLLGDSRTSESIPEPEAPSEPGMVPTGMTEGTAEGDCYYDYYQPTDQLQAGAASSAALLVAHNIWRLAVLSRRPCSGPGANSAW